MRLSLPDGYTASPLSGGAGQDIGAPIDGDGGDAGVSVGGGGGGGGGGPLAGAPPPSLLAPVAPACARVRAAEGTRPAAVPAGRAPRGARVAAARGRGRQQPTGRHAAIAARCARNGHSPSSAMIASGDLICMEGIICIGW